MSTPTLARVGVLAFSRCCSLLGLSRAGRIEMDPGDVVVLRANRHAWRLVGDEPAKMAFVLIASPSHS